MKQIAVLMTVFNRKDTTLSCLRTLFSQSIPRGFTISVWLTNDGCTDGTPDAIRKLYSQVHIIDGDGSLFWNRGMWTAWEAASKYYAYDYYLWLNDDTLIYDNAISKLIETSVLFENKSCIVGSTQSTDHKTITYGGFVKKKNVVPNGTPAEVDNFNGNIVLVPAYVYNKIGNLDRYYRHCHGDTDYGLRAGEAGLKNYIVGEYLGECNRHERYRKCWSKDVPIIDRFKDLYKPTGYPPMEAFYFEKRHIGLAVAIFHLFTLYVRVIIPWAWEFTGKARK